VTTDTVVGDPNRGSEADIKGISTYLNRRMWEIPDGVEITVDLQGDEHSGIVAYKGKGSDRPVELDRINYYEPADFWEAIPVPDNGRIILQAGGFYLLASKKRVRVPLDHAAEMVAHDPSMGEFRVHYAGFFDPGFGERQSSLRQCH